MADYSRDRADADKSIREAGLLVTLRRTAAGPYDPVTGTETQTVTDYSAWGVMFDFSAQKLQPGSVVQPGDKQLYLATLQTNGSALPALEPTDIIIAGTVQYAIVNPGVIAPNGQRILYELQLRKA